MIRPVEAADFAAIARITNHYIATTAIHFAYESVTTEELRAHWAEDRARYPWRAAVDAGGALVGFAKAGTWRERDAYRWTAEVGLYVDPAHHRRGVGRALYADLIPALAAAGFHSLIAGVTLPNPPSLALHLAFGFAPVGTVRDAGYKFDAWHDVAFYQLVLQPTRAPLPSTETASRST